MQAGHYHASQQLGTYPLDEGHSVPNLAFTDVSCVRQHGILNTGFSSPGELENNPQHLGCRRLLLQRFAQIIRALAQLVEQPCVLDGDDGLGGEVR